MDAYETFAAFVKFQKKPLFKLKLVFFLLFLFYSFNSFSQNGSSGSPFTALYQAKSVAPGVYYFNIGGVNFSTYVKNSWILVANDSGGSTGVLPLVVALSNAERGVLTPTVLAAFTGTPELNLTTSDGNVNVTSTNAGLIHRMIFDSALYMGTYNSDKTNNASWTGTGQTWVRGAGAACAGTSLGIHLDSVLIWPCGDGSGFHWIPVDGYHRESWALGEAANTVAFSLWAQAGVTVLPITISSFQGTLLSNNTIELEWTTESELNGNYILVEKSSNGSNWAAFSRQNIQAGSNMPVSYTASDDNPNYGDNYYRLAEIDLDGSAHYSQIVVVRDLKASAPVLFPNPASDNATLEGEAGDLRSIKVYSVIGQDLTSMVKQTRLSENTVRLNFALLPKGILFIRTAHYMVKVIVD